MDAAVYAWAAQVEDRHWWFRGRRGVVGAVLERYVTRAAGQSILEVGCGNGGNLSMLAAYGEVCAVELDDAARERAVRRGIGTVEKGWLPDGLPFATRCFDVIAALDVLEHIEDDRRALAALLARLRPCGRLILTVPAYPWLWSAHDERTHHRRRYTRVQLAALLTAQGFQVLYSTYFNTILFPGAAAAIWLGRQLGGGAGSAPRIPAAPLNRLLDRVFLLESLLVPRFSLPFGLSILVCAGAR